MAQVVDHRGKDGEEVRSGGEAQEAASLDEQGRREQQQRGQRRDPQEDSTWEQEESDLQHGQLGTVQYDIDSA